MDTIVVPVQFSLNQSKGVGINPGQVEPLSFAKIPTGSADVRITEPDLEEFIRKNVRLMFPSDETLLIVGQQVINKEGGRSDLVAVDGEGNTVLIELKRDPSDIVSRKEALEFQAIRYAANYALIKEPR